MSARKPTVLVLGGGPDAERAVSLDSARAVASALRDAGHEVAERTIDRPALDELRAMPGDVIAPILHGRFGEGGPLQDLLVADGRPFVGAGPRAARLAMDKVAAKAIARSLGITASTSCVLDRADPVCPLPLPVVVKPIHEGSTIGLRVCRDEAAWRRAHDEARETDRPTMIEPFVAGRELTVGVLGGEALPIIEIRAASGLYDYEAKYERDDTIYTPDPELPPGVGERLAEWSVALAQRLGAPCLARADYILDGAGEAWLLELNTMPGFTSHSLVPMAARARRRDPLEMPALCARLVEIAVRDRAAESARSA